MPYIRNSNTKIKKEIPDPKNFIYVPRNFEPEKYSGAIARHPDAARWMLSTIYFRRLTRNYDRTTFINLHSELLSLVMGDMALVKPVREALAEHGLIECDYEWSTGKKSLGYRLGPVLADVTWQQFASTDKRFMKRVEKFKKHEFDHKVTIPVRQHLVDWVKRVEFSDKLDGVIASLPDTPYKGCDHGNKRAYAQHQVEMIRAGNWQITESCSYGRLHTNITSLVGELRRCLILDGQELVEVDIVNSQPYFLSTILFELFQAGHCSSSPSRDVFSSSSDHSLFVSSFPETEEEEGEQPRATGTHPYVFGLRVESGGLGKMENTQTTKDLDKLMRDTREGRFYETIQAFAPQLDRDTIKRTIFQVIFGEKKMMEVTPLGQAFQSAYPTAAEIMVQVKKEKGYRWIGHELQRRESHLVIQTVCERLRADFSHIPVLTVHDSILTTREHLETVRGLLAQAFQKYTHAPTFKVKEPA